MRAGPRRPAGDVARRARAETEVIALAFGERQVRAVELQVPAGRPALVGGEAQRAAAVFGRHHLAARRDARRLERPTVGAGGEIRVGQDLLARDLRVAAPGRAQARHRLIACPQPGVPLSLSSPAYGSGRSSRLPAQNGSARVLVVHLHAEHGRLGDVGVPGVRVRVRSSARA